MPLFQQSGRGRSSVGIQLRISLHAHVPVECITTHYDTFMLSHTTVTRPEQPL